ncbi:uncharacterized protein LOC133175810 isoform X1 [Saccostrea echinata]|uniref:uncharacterized protein LOC133175810 isoform X1 n=2 Tax=Saccostrea echinata TaxID=191078 RepID=UPI002A7F5DEF|nr:uncharacterized protein LOC133175810 isoform X1 [Saccostrea echinata]
MGSGGSTEAVKQPEKGGSVQRNEPRRDVGGEGQNNLRVRSDSPVNNNTPRNAKTKFIVKKDDSVDLTNDLNLDSYWNNDSKAFSNNNQEKQYNDYNSKQKNSLPPRLPSPPVEDLPETYAQRGFREQYRPNDLLRQKTIYRDPEEWELPEKRESVGSFDVSKFQAANANVQSQQKRDIFTMTPDYTKNTRQTDSADDLYRTPTYQKQKSVPKYDISEEELMADIEKGYI